MKLLRALGELARAAVMLVLAKARGVANPCPPHIWTQWGFCEKCGVYRDATP